jgi:hypothetical protein
MARKEPSLKWSFLGQIKLNRKTLIEVNAANVVNEEVVIYKLPNGSTSKETVIIWVFILYRNSPLPDV